MSPQPSQEKRKPFLSLRLKDLHDSLENSLLVRHIAVPLESCASSKVAKAIQGYMEQQNFDLFGVTENGSLKGYVRREDLGAGMCRDYVRPFNATEIISSATPLTELLPLLRVKTYMFVVERSKLAHLVSRGDLQESPMRMLLFGLVSLLEMNLLEMVHICYPDKSFRDKLRPHRLAKANTLLASLRKKDQDIELISCLTMTDKRELLIRVDSFVPFFHLGDEKEAGKRLKEMEELRDKLAHGQDFISGSEWNAILAVAADLEAFLKRVDDKRDEFVEKFGRRGE